MIRKLSMFNCNKNCGYQIGSYKSGIAIFWVLLLILSSAAELSATDSVQVRRPIGKPLLRQQSFLRERFGDSETDASFRLRANSELESIQIKYNKYFESLQSTSPEWKNIGPFDIGGRVRSIAVHPGNPSILYIGAAAGGIWKSTNAGSSWLPIFDFYNATSFGALAIDPNNPNTIYAGTGEMIIGGGIPYLGNGIYKSTDAGNSWQQIGLTNVAAFSKIYVHPLNSNLVYAGGAMRNGGLYKSLDGGNNWEKIYDGNITDISINPKNQNEIYLGVNILGVLYSSDAGKSWDLRSQGLTNLGGRVSVQSFEGDSKILYALIERQDSRGAIFKSLNGGLSWSMVHNGNSSFFNSQGYYNSFIAIHPNNSNLVLAGGIELWLTVSGGATWATLNDKTIPQAMHVDQHHAVFAPSQNNIVYVANDGGVYKSTNSGLNWVDINKGLMITQFYALTIDNKQKNRNFGGTQDNGTVGNPGNDWKMVVGGDGFDCFVHPNDPNIVFGEIYYGDVFRYEVSKNDYNFIRKGLPTDDIGAWHSPFVFDDNNHTMYLGKTAIYASYNYGEDFYQITPRYTHQFTALATSPRNSRIIYGGNRVGQIIISKDAGINWQNVNSSSLPGKYITDIKASSVDESTVYAAFSGFGNRHIFKSEDYGNNWFAIDLSLPDIPVNSILLHPENESIIFAATDIGVFVTTNGGEDWMPFGEKLPRTPVLDLQFHTNRVLLPELTLRAATHGRSIWEIEVPQVILAEPAIVNPAGGEYYIGASTNEFSWLGFEYPTKLEFAESLQDNFVLIKDSIYTNRFSFALPDLSSYTARIRVTSLKNGVQKISNTFSIEPKYKGAILAQLSLGYNTYGLKCSGNNNIWVVDYRNGIINLYDKQNFSLIKKVESPVKGFYSDITANPYGDTIYLHKMGSENGDEAELVVIDSSGNLIKRVNSPAKYPMGLAYSDGLIYASERDGEKRIFTFDTRNNYSYKAVAKNPVLAEFGPRCITYNNNLIHQVSTFFNSNVLTKSEITVFNFNTNGIVETIPITDRSGTINARGIDIDPEDGNYWVSNFSGNIYKIAAGDNVTSVNYEKFPHFSIYPNPANDYLHVNLNESIRKVESDGKVNNIVVQIFNTLGIEVIRDVIPSEIEKINVNISELVSGFYIIKIGNRVEKFIKI